MKEKSVCVILKKHDKKAIFMIDNLGLQVLVSWDSYWFRLLLSSVTNLKMLFICRIIIHYFIDSFIFSKHFTLGKVAMDPEPIPGTLGARQEYNRI